MSDTKTVVFYLPSSGSPYPERTDERVRVLDRDEVSLTSRVEFPDGLRAVVPVRDLVTRQA